MPERRRLKQPWTLTTFLACALWSSGALAWAWASPAPPPAPASALAWAEAPESPAQTAPPGATRSAEKKRTKAERRAEEKSRKERAAAAKAGKPVAETATAAADSTSPSPVPTASDPAVVAAPIAETAAAAADQAPVPSDFEGETLEADAAEAPTDDGVDGPALLADSLAAYESAQALWEQGLVDEAFATLDRAYEMMAAVDVERDPLRAQEKEDLRRLISRRVIEIYASRPTAAGDVEGSIPLDMNEHVQREILSFSGPERQFFLESYLRSAQHRPMMLDELRAAGMPLELSWMPLVESGFKVRAYSVARALGLWQFIPSTGYRFGLERNNWIDERMDPQKATRAAIAYLTELHGLFGDWLTALAAYNCGEHLVLRLLSSQPVSYFDHFWDLYLRLPRETRRYVPRFLAVRAILEDPAAYGFDLPVLGPPLEIETVRTERTADLGELEKRLGLPDGTIKGLNPELRRNATPAEPYDVKVPKGMVDQVAAVIPQLPTRVLTADTAPGGSSAASGPGTHRVRPGETLSRIAARYGTSVGTLVALNGLSSANRILPGQTLRVRSGASGSGSRSSGSPVASKASTGSSGGATTHKVRRGDNLWLIAQRYGTTVDRIKSDNGLRSNLLQVGQKLVIHGERSATGAG